MAGRPLASAASSASAEYGLKVMLSVGGRDDDRDARRDRDRAAHAPDPSEGRLLQPALLQEAEIDTSQHQCGGHHPRHQARREAEREVRHADRDQDHAEHALHPDQPVARARQALQQVGERASTR
jgi:hypothetical protein